MSGLAGRLSGFAQSVPLVVRHDGRDVGRIALASLDPSASTADGEGGQRRRDDGILLLAPAR